MNRLYTNSSGSNFVEFSSSRTPLTKEIATRQTQELWISLYDALPNPDPVLKKSGKSIEILDEIKREPQVSTCKISRKSGVKKRPWKLEQEHASANAVSTVEKILKNLKMRATITEMLDAWGYGYSVGEVVWKREGNLLVPDRIVGKPQSWFHFGKENELRIKTKPGDWRGEPVHDRKFLLTSYEASFANPYGEAQYSMCFWPVTFKKGGLKFWAKFLEKFGMPHAAGKLPRGADAAERNELIRSLGNMVQDAVAVFPDDASIELLTTNVTGSSDAYETFAHYHDAQISKVILGHSGAADSTPGRLGNDEYALKVRTDIIDDDSDMIEESFNTLIKWIHELNPSLGQQRCRFEIYEQTNVDKDRAERDSQLLNTGRVKLSKNYFVKRYDYDEDDIEVVEPAATFNPEFSAPATAKAKETSVQSSMDELIDSLPATLLQKQIEGLLKPVLELVEKAESFDEITSGVANLFPDLDSKEIENLIEKLTFAGTISGQIDDTGK